MRSLEKLRKISKAIVNTMQAKNGSTDFLYHLKKEFSNQDIKKLFHSMFDKEYLKEEKILKEQSSKIDKRKVEYRLDALHELYNKYVEFCKKNSKNINCKKIVSIIILNIFLNCIDNEYDILEKIENELKSTLLPPRERDRGLLGFSSPSILYQTSFERILSDELKQISDSLNKEKIDQEIKFIQKIFQNF